MTVEIRNLSFRYESGVEALKDISFSIQPGERVALLGHNGSGKSTLVRHFNGLLRPSQGEVLINGFSTAGEKVSRLAGMVGLLFQNPDDQICKGTVWDETVFGPENLGYPSERTEALARSALSVFGLMNMKDRNPHDLGLSERKRLAMASVLAMDTGIVVLDEPTAGLDPGEVEMLEAALRRLESAGRIVLIISHDMDFIAENTSRAICLENGCKRFDGNIVDLFYDREILERCGLQAPQVVRLGARFNLRLSTLTPQGFIDEFKSAQ